MLEELVKYQERVSQVDVQVRELEKRAKESHPTLLKRIVSFFEVYSPLVLNDYVLVAVLSAGVAGGVGYFLDSKNESSIQQSKPLSVTVPVAPSPPQKKRKAESVVRPEEKQVPASLQSSLSRYEDEVAFRNSAIKIFDINTSPRGRTGVTANIRSSCWDKAEGSDNADITNLFIYEDGNRIASSRIHAFFLGADVTHQTPGVHTYQAECIDKNNISVRTKPVRLEFTGTPMDLPVNVAGYLSFSIYKDGFAISTSDKGDNKGIQDIFLFEDGRLVKRLNGGGNDHFWVHIPFSSLGSYGAHSYHVQVIDNGGNVSTSEKITATIPIQIPRGRASGTSGP